MRTYIGVGSGDLDLDLAKSRVELLLVDLLVSVETVEVSEGSSKSADGLGTSGLDLSSNLLKNYNNQSVRQSLMRLNLTFKSHFYSYSL